MHQIVIMAASCVMSGMGHALRWLGVFQHLGARLTKATSSDYARQRLYIYILRIIVSGHAALPTGPWSTCHERNLATQRNDKCAVSHVRVASHEHEILEVYRVACSDAASSLHKRQRTPPPARLLLVLEVTV